MQCQLNCLRGNGQHPEALKTVNPELCGVINCISLFEGVRDPTWARFPSLNHHLYLEMSLGYTHNTFEQYGQWITEDTPSEHEVGRDTRSPSWILSPEVLADEMWPTVVTVNKH